MSDCDFLLIATHAEKYAPKNEQGDNAIIDFSLKNSILVTLDQDQKKNNKSQIDSNLVFRRSLF